MLKYMLDTNMVIYTMKNRPEHVKIRFNQKRVFEGIPDEGRFTGPPGAE
jgi:predicted nucleic acid-binding protein